MLANFVKETVSGTPGIGDISLGGKFDASFIAVATVFADGDVFYYSVEDGNDRELGIGTYEVTGDKVLRTTPLETIDSGVYDNTSPAAISLTSAAIITITALSQAMNGKARLTDATYKYFHPDNFSTYETTSAKVGGACSASAGRITARPIYFKHRTLITTLGAEINTVDTGQLFNLAIYGSYPHITN